MLFELKMEAWESSLMHRLFVSEMDGGVRVMDKLLFGVE